MRLPRVFLAAAILASSAIAFTDASATKPTCSIPQLFAPAFAAGEENQLTWALPDPAVTGSSGYQIQVARSDVTKQGGGFADFVDGKPNIVRSSIHVPEGWLTWPVDGLDEETYHYHVRIAPNNLCDPPLDPWSNIVATTQDDTPPQVTVDTGSGELFLPGPVVITGTATDVPGEKVLAASGVKDVRIRIDHTTPVLGATYPTIPSVTAPVSEDGSWSVTYEHLPLGTYRAEITARDLVHNVTPQPVQITFIVVSV